MRPQHLGRSALCCVLVVLLGPETCLAADDPPLTPGFEHFYNNEYDEALAIFEESARLRPHDADPCNWVAQALLYREMYRNGALESQLVTGSNSFLRRQKMEVSPQNKALFSDSVSRAIALSEARLRENRKDIPALHALAVSHGLRANFLFLVEKSWMQALHESIAGRKANDQILEIDPNVIEAHLLRGLSEYVVSCLPAYLRLLGSFNGFHGDKENGIRQLQMVSQSRAGNRFDAAILLAAIYRREHRPKDAIPLLTRLAQTFPRNYLFRLEQVQMYSDLGDKQAALRILSDMEGAVRTRAPGYGRLSMERVQYARGNLFFWYGDLQPSLEDLKLVTVRANDLDLSTAVMAWMRLGQVYDLTGDHPRAEEAYKAAISTAPNSEVAKEAAGYISKPYSRQKTVK